MRRTGPAGPLRYDEALIYTCYEMIQDCRSGRAEGWSYFLTQYVPVVRGLVAHYFPDRAADPAFIEGVLTDLRKPESSLFQSLDPAPERAFVAELRQHVLKSAGQGAAPDVAIDLETLGGALEPLTLTEKLAAWLKTMRYSAADTGRMLRMSPETSEKIRARAGELIRGSVDTWGSRMLADNGTALGCAASALSTKDCLPPKAFFDVIDGRATWRGREEMERHVTNCWHCVDHYSRLLEAVDVLRSAKPLAKEEAETYRRMLSIPTPKRSFWKR